MGLDASAVAIAHARAKAHDRGLAARFVQGDALRLSDLDERFDTVIDSGLLHVLSDEQMQLVIEGVRGVLAPGGHYGLLCFSERATLPGPRRLSRERIATLFRQGWEIKSIEAAHFAVLPGPGREDAEKAAAAWLVDLERT